MTSNRHTTPEPSVADRLLDAARDSILSVGWRRTTLTDVARRAGVSRMTVYRTYPDMPALLGDLMTREWAEVVAGVEAGLATGRSDDPAVPTGTGGADEAGRIATRLVATVAALRDNDLVRRIIDVDPELLLPYLLDRRGRAQDAVLDLLAARISEAQTGGGVRPGDPVLLARTIVLAAHGFLLSAPTMLDGHDGLDGLNEHSVTLATLDAELTELVRGYLS